MYGSTLKNRHKVKPLFKEGWGFSIFVEMEMISQKMNVIHEMRVTLILVQKMSIMLHLVFFRMLNTALSMIGI